MAEVKKKRLQLTKAEKRVLAEVTTKVAFGDELRRKLERDAKTDRLRALRLKQKTDPLI